MKGKFKAVLAVFIALMFSCPAFAIDANRYAALILGGMYGAPAAARKDVAKSGDKSVNTPIIIVPGIMGSRLFTSASEFTEETKAWDPIVMDASGQIDLGRSVYEKIGVPVEGSSWGLLSQRLSGALYVRPCENQNVGLSPRSADSTVYQYGKEYGALNRYQALVEYLCNEYASGDKYRAVYFFSYDWRQSNAESARKLRDCIGDILRETGAKKVNLVCHSMGGLVASKYYKEYASDQQIDCIITCGTPYEGAPELINGVIQGNALGEDWMKALEKALKEGEGVVDILKKIFDIGFLSFVDRSFKSSFTGVTELLPTENYIDSIPMYYHSVAQDPSASDTLSFPDYQGICRGTFSGYDSAKSFQDSLKDGDYNALLKYDKAYFILGINQKTIAAIKFARSAADPLTIYADDLVYSAKGDGKVPYFSASICEQLDKLGEGRALRHDTDHEGVVKKEDCLKWIVDKLNRQATSVSGSETRSDGHIVVRIACPVDVAISNSDGDALNSSLKNFARTSSFGHLDVIGLSDDIKMACIDSSPNFSIVMNGTDTGTMDYDIRYFNGDDEIYKEDSFRNIPITASTVIKTGTDGAKTTVLEVDKDGDGKIDDYLVPDISMGAITVTRQPESQTVKAGEYAAFAVEASGANLRYQWNINRHDGRGWALIPGATDAAYTSGPVDVSDDGNEYHCLLTDGEGRTVSTKAASLYVHDGGGGSGGGCSSGFGALALMAGAAAALRRKR